MSVRDSLPALLRPRVVFPTLVVLVVVSVLLTPRTPPGNVGTVNLTTHSYDDGGASGLAETVERLGWRVVRLAGPLSDTMSSNAIYAVLVPDARLTAADAHILLDRVRAGASMIALAGDIDAPWSDSLHLATGSMLAALSVDRGDTTSCEASRRSLRNVASMFPLALNSLMTVGVVQDTVHLAVIQSPQARRSDVRLTWPTVIGVRLGRGRLALVADPRLLSNNALRTCRWGAGITAVRIIEWLAARDREPPLGTLVFDEYHHGYGRHASTTRVAFGWLTSTTSGRTAAQLAIAALVLLIAMAPRPVPPLPRHTIARRSPLEHVTALAQAYEQVRATRTATRLLVQGLRRRLTRIASLRRMPDDAYLASLAAHHAPIADPVARVSHAMTNPIPASELIEVATAVDRIERSLRP